MSSIIDALYEIKYNPFVYGSYLASFYSEIEETENNLLLAPLVIPLCSHPILGQKLFNSNKRSTIWSVFDDRAKLYDLQERIDGFKELTKQCIDYCLVNDWLTVNEQRFSLIGSNTSDPKFVSQKSAEKLGGIFNDLSVVEICAFLGVKLR